MASKAAADSTGKASGSPKEEKKQTFPTAEGGKQAKSARAGGGRGRGWGRGGAPREEIVISDTSDVSSTAPSSQKSQGSGRGGGRGRGRGNGGEQEAQGKSRDGGRGGSGGAAGGRGRGRGGGREGSPKQPRADPNEVKCYLCGQVGHLGADCPSGQAEMSNAKVTTLRGGASVIDVEGDLMTSPDSLCHCVSQCLAMGKGVAVLFKQTFGGVDELKAQGVTVPGVAVLHRPTEAVPDRHVYYLITKPKYFDKPTYDTLAASLGAMFSHMNAHGITRVAMPEIGCGLDGLSWPRVHEMICSMIDDTGITVTVYHFKPAQQMWSRKGKYA